MSAETPLAEQSIEQRRADVQEFRERTRLERERREQYADRAYASTPEMRQARALEDLAPLLERIATALETRSGHG